MAFTRYLNVDTLNRMTDILREAGYALRNADRIDKVAYRNSNQAWDGKRPSWFPGIKRAVVRMGRVEVRSPDLILIACNNCGLPHTASGIQIDHIGGYEAIIDKCCQNPTNLEARIAYNSLDNLRAICSFCNGKHPESEPVAKGVRGAAAAYVRAKIKEYVDGAAADGE